MGPLGWLAARREASQQLAEAAAQPLTHSNELVRSDGTEKQVVCDETTHGLEICDAMPCETMQEGYLQEQVCEFETELQDFADEQSRLLFRVQELEKERDAGLWQQFQNDRLQAEIDRALATQRAELELKWAEAQVVSMSNMREQLQARFDVQLAETQRALKAEYSNKLADAMYEKNAILEHLEVNRKELVRQIRELSAREVALPCPAPAAAAPDGSPAVLEEVMREHLAAMRAQLKGDIQEAMSGSSGDEPGSAARGGKWQALQSQKEELERQLAQARVERDTAVAMREKFEAERDLAQRTIQGLSSQVKDLQDRQTGMREDEQVRGSLKVLEAENSKLTLDLADAVERYTKEYRMRRKLHNQLLEMKGNIRVFCRVRPLTPRELAMGPAGAVCTSFPMEGEVRVHKKLAEDGSLEASRTDQLFEFDEVFGMDSAQEEVFQQTRALLQSCFDGFNVTMLAYGQTGAGKTHTMQGSAAEPGVCRRAVGELFQIAQERRKEVTMTLAVSVMELYNDTVRDLLAPKPADSRLDIKHDPDGRISIPGLIERPLDNLENFVKIMDKGNANRATFATSMNSHSSRSHLICLVKVSAEHLQTGVTTQAKLYLVDLAGSERVLKSDAAGDRLKEAQSINKSLSCIGDVMASLKQKTSHVPYRNSKLTFLLSDSLGGQAKVLMFVNVSPSMDNVGESLSSLSFASRTRSVELGQAKKALCSPRSSPMAKSPYNSKANLKK